MHSSKLYIHSQIYLYESVRFPAYWFAFFIYGAQITRPYSRWGLANMVKSFLKNGPSRYDKLPRIKPAMAFAFLNFVEIYSSSFKGASRITQRSFLSKSCSNSFLWNIVIRFLLLFLFECQMYVNLADLKCKTITLLKWCNITKLELVLWFLIFYKI